jgi:hypothetical protein
MSAECTASEDGFVIRGIEGYPFDVILEWAKPGWSARPDDETDNVTRDSALTRTRAVERMLRQSVTDEAKLEAMMTEVDKALDACPEKTKTKA